MRKNLSLRWLSILLVAAVFATAGAPVHAAPLQQQPTVTIIILGFVDVAGGNDPQCPGCNGEFDPEDQQVAQDDPLPAFTIIVRDMAGQELARETTQPLAGLQRVSIDIPEDTEYTVVLEGDPTGWLLCPNESSTRQLTADDFQLGNALEEFHFWKGCASQPTATPTATTEPGVEPTVPPGPEPTKKPDDGGAEKKEEQPEEGPGLGSIRGLAFIDTNQDGLLGPDEPGLNDVGVHLIGGGAQMFQVTNAAGQYSFDGLGAGPYDVFIDPGPEWRVTTTKKYGAVQVSGTAVLGIDFGMVRVGEVPAAPAEDPELVVPQAGAGIRLPATGIAEVPTNRLLGIMALVLGVLAVLGFSSERFNRR